MRHHPLLLLLACLLLSPPPAAAALRSPQVPVAGSALATFFLAQSQAINPATDQQDLQQLSVFVGASFQLLPLGPEATTTTVGAYNTVPALPTLYQIVPGAAPNGWFTVCTFRTAPDRLIVNLFDAQAVFQGTTTYLGADRNAFGFYAQGAGGTVYLQDFRNPLGAARILAYNGTGPVAGYTWFAIETGSTTGGDFADVIVLANMEFGPVSVEHASWGTLKHRFR